MAKMTSVLLRRQEHWWLKNGQPPTRHDRF
jgi:hypothetical protein